MGGTPAHACLQASTRLRLLSSLTACMPHACALFGSMMQVSIGEDGGVTIKGLFSEAKVVTADVEAGDANE
jgi:hypothetical protein